MKVNLTKRLFAAFNLKLNVLVVLGLFFSVASNAQVINEGFEETEWQAAVAASSSSGQVIITSKTANSIMSYVTTAGSTTTTSSINTCPNSGTWWYSRAGSNTVNATYTKTDKVFSKTHSIKLSSSGYVITPITPAAVVNVSFWASGPVSVGMATDPSVGQPFYSSGNPIPYSYNSTVYPAGNGSMQPYNFTGTFSGPCRLGFFNNSGNSLYIDDIRVELPTGNPPSVTTNSVTPVGITNATVNGSVTLGSPNPYLPLLTSGVIWGTTAALDTSFTTKTRDNVIGASASYNITDIAQPLLPNTAYFAMAYVIALDGSVYYGVAIPFSTNPTTAPVVTTATPSFISSNKAITGGAIVDSGGCSITQKGVCWGTSANPTFPNPPNQTIDGSGGAAFTSTMKLLSPATTYHYRAYAINNCKGISYGGDSVFTTAPAVPAITAVPGNLDFGDNTYQSTYPILSYNLSAKLINPANDNITITAPAGYKVSTSINTNYNSSITVPCSGGNLASKKIYVQLSTANYGPVNGYILHTQASVTPQNADTVFLTGNIVQNQDTLTNRGTDFWTGFGYQNNMASSPTNSDAAQMSIYIATGNASATVKIELPGITGATGFPQTWTIPANTVKEITGFPIGTVDQFNSGGGPDSRLYYTGISNRGVHITSTNSVPVSVWMHTYTANNSAGASMVFPTNTWGSAYSVQAYGGMTNSGKASSFFFVMAKDDNTAIEFKPSNDIVDSSAATIFQEGSTAANVKYKKDSIYVITLNKGQIFNAMSFVQGSGGNSAVGLDLSGTSIKTVDCTKRIAVFGGSGRVLVATATTLVSKGSDNLVQQMFPKVAWGTKYLTVPTKTMEYNLFRINVQDPTTNVWVNNAVHTAATALPASQLNVRGQFYPIEGSRLNIIESDKPISVTQFIIAGSAPDGKDVTHPLIGNGGSGDPEMIILSPVQQAINQVTVYSSNFKNGGTGGSYINVVLKNAGIASFKLDNKVTADTGLSSYSNVGVPAIYGAGTNLNIPMTSIFKVHPGDTTYSWAKFRVASGLSHSISSDYGFNAIAYGVDQGESYGYNAGTAINNLSSVKVAVNPNGTDTSTGTIRTCKNNPVTVQIALPYNEFLVDSIIWDAGNDTRVTPNGPNRGAINSGTNHAQIVGTIVKDGRTFNIYQSPVVYTFSEEGAYKVKATAYGTFSSDCGGVDYQNISILVTHDDIKFTATPASCGSRNVSFVNQTDPIPGTTISKWTWDFGDGTPVDNVTTSPGNPTVNPHAYPATPDTFWTKMTTINSIGCFSIDSAFLDLRSSLLAAFTVNKDSICPNQSVTVTDQSPTATGGFGNIVDWIWSWGDATKNDTTHVAGATVSHNYTIEGPHTLSLVLKTDLGCPSIQKDTTITVKHKPIANFTPPAGVCLPGSTLFINNTDTAVSGACTYYWNFGDGIGTSTIKDPSYAYNIPVPAAGYTIKLVSTSSFGCVSDTVSKTITNIYDKPTASFTITKDSVCLGTAANFTGSFTGLNQTAASWHWFMGDTKDTVNAVSTLSYTYTAIGSYNVQMIAVSDKGCVSDTFPVSPAVKTVVVNPIPVAHFILPGSCLSSGSVTFLDSSYVVPADINPFTYSWSFGSVAKDGVNTYNAPGTYPVTHTVTTSAGCTNSETLNYTVAGTKPKPYFTVLNETNLCSNIDVQINDTSRNDIGAIKTIQILWDITDATSLQTDNAPTTGGAGSSHIYTHTYPKLGVTKTYTIRLIAYSGPGCGDSTADYQITVYGSPKVVFNSTPQKGICAEATPRNLSTVAGETNGLAGSWMYSGTGISGATFDPAISGVGTYNIQALFITNTPTIGCRDSAQSPITVWATPTVAYKISDTTCEKQTVNFNDLSVAGAGSGNIKTWLWTFGEPFPAFTKNTTHKFSTNGAFIISLKVTTDSGCTAKHDSIITVHPLPKIGFRLPTAICLPAGVSQFIDTSSIADGSEAQFRYLWNFDDIPTGVNNTATIANPTHVFSSPGSFNIKLQITSKDNCVNIDSTLLPASLIHPQPKAGFKTSVAEVCLGGAPILFTDTSKGLVKTYYWDFYGDQSAMGTGKKTTYQYTIAGLFDAMHYIDDNFGCRSDTAHAIITIDSLPVVRGGGIKYIVSGTSEVLTPYVSGADTVMWSPLTYLTDYITASPTCTPKKDITYLLTARSLEGCLSSDSVRVSILQVPVIPNAFSPNGDGVNDTWDITYLNLYEGASVQVFNRYGQMVYTSLGYPTPWKGNMLNTGDALPVGVYYYIIKAGNKIPQLTGSLTIVR